MVLPILPLSVGLEWEVTPTRQLQPPVTHYETHLEVKTGIAQWGYCSLWFSVFRDSFAYYGFLEDMGMEGSQTAQRRSVLLWRRLKPHLLCNHLQTSVQLEST